MSDSEQNSKAKIDKLSIIGVRSFDNQISETIQFFSPLTLIVGYNGSGKTTIIECLKYATTGQLPAHSKSGGAFIHDPNLCHEKEVLAQVKLSFVASNGARMVTTRKLQLSVKKTSRSQSKLEASLLSMKNGERTVISSKDAELEKIMPQYLGASKAILEHVIFCHQDESLWPMSEPAKLKDRFDEIFEALKYTKVIDNIKVLRKTQNEELGKYKIIEQHAKEDKVKGDRAEKLSSDLFDEMEALRADVQDMDRSIRSATAKSEEAWEHAAKFEKTVAELEGKRIEERAKRDNVNRLQRNIKHLDHTDDELQDMLDKYEERVQTFQESRQTQTKHYNELLKEVENARKLQGEKQKDIGTYEAQKAQFERQVEHRKELIKETARRHNIRGYDLDVTDDLIRDFMDRIGRLTKDQNAALERARRETQDELQTAQATLNQHNERKSALNQSKENARTQIAANDRKISALQTDLDKTEIDEGGRTILESSMGDVEQRLKKVKQDVSAAEWDNQIGVLDEKLRIFDDTKEKLDAELIQGTQQATESARLDYLGKELKDRQKSLKTMVNTHGEQIADVVGSGWQSSGLEHEFQAVVHQKSTDLKDAETQRDGISKELEQVDFRLTGARNDYKQKTEESKSCEKVVRDATGEEPSGYLEYVDQVQQERDILRKDFDGYAYMRDYYEKALKYQEDRNECRLCARKFTGSSKTSDVDKFRQNIQAKMTAAALGTIKDELEATEHDLKMARDAYSSHQVWKRLSDSDVPKLETEVQQLESRRSILIRKVEEQDQSVSERQEAKRDVESLSRTVQNIVKYNTDVTHFESQIQELTAKQKEKGLSRGLEQIRDEITRVNEQVRNTKSALARLNSDKERGRSQVATLEIEARDIRAKISDAVYQLKEKSSLRGQINDLRALNSEQRDSRNNADHKLQELIPQIEQARAKYDDIGHRGDERQRILQQEASRLSDSVNQVRVANSGIEQYIARGGQQQLSQASREMEDIAEQLARLEQEQREITVEVKEIDDQLRNTDDTKRGISDNLVFRQDQRALEGLCTQIDELESTNAAADKKRYEREGSEWQLERNRLAAEQASIMGQLKSKDDQLKQLLKDWETDYKDAGYKYREAHIKVETTKAAVEDLGRYASALDKAIMKYHSLKMEEINRIIDELWRRTYQGTDVDTVLIRSDGESARGNKSYNYRVCMVKQDAEMDMRGRCSAGQKVLASIIIRLALAECFGVNCGLIALDEPTTNLDRSNIKALAESLAEIIRVRRAQSNFQLIIITHDEEFLRDMQCADFADYYWRVSRDANVKSIIRKQNIAAVLSGP
ncbi:MAG: DNA repair protein rad50 [Bathelium mastoideum]|nr:MAG: DNA repair protein rad50 [Bathelium mastoideum]KAI9690016.1 MAG: DNA repair protein rad50 [Bathelium mastoideum]